MEKSLFTFIFCTLILGAGLTQQSLDIQFQHVDRTVYGTLSLPAGTGPFPIVIINPGTGANDRDGTIPMVGANIECLYPQLLNETLRPYRDLGTALTDSGYAVLRYDKLEFTYPTSLGTITFEKLWLPVRSAIDFVKTRPEIDTTRIILLGHSEGSTLIPIIAKDRQDIHALISVGGPRTPFDSLLAYQLVLIADTCGGNVPLAQLQANQILNYFQLIRTNTWNASTPPLFGVTAAVWYDYVTATDPVADHYNTAALPTLFVGMENDINVPPAELIRFENDVTITDDFWSVPGLNHFMTPADDPQVSAMLTDTIIYWLRQQAMTSSTTGPDEAASVFRCYPNPVRDVLTIEITGELTGRLTFILRDTSGQAVLSERHAAMLPGQSTGLNLARLPAGMYVLEVKAGNGSFTRVITKE